MKRLITIRTFRILVISPFFYPHMGGSQRYMEELYAMLIKKHKNIRVDVLCYNTAFSKHNSLYRGMRIERIPCWTILKGQFVLPHIIPLFTFLFKNRNNYDVIHASTRFFDSAFWTPLYAKIIKKPVLLTDHCASHPIHENPLVTFVAKIADLLIGSIALYWYDKVLVTSKAAEKFLKDTFGVRSTVLYGGIDQVHSRKFIVHRSRKKIKVLFAGRMIESKGVVMLFNIVKKIKQLDVVFAGEGPLVKVLKEKVRKERLGNIRVIGGIGRKELAQLMQKSDILVHPSMHHEGFPNVLTEAGAASNAVIATDVGGSREIVIHDKTGILVKPGDEKALKKSVEKLIKNKSLREKFGKALYEHVVKNFSWEKASWELYRILTALV